MSLAAPIQYTDSRQMLADYAARRRRLFPSLTLVSREAVGLVVPVETPPVEVKDSTEEATDIPNFLALRPRATEWAKITPKAALRTPDTTVILRLVSQHTGVSIRDLKSDRRTSDVVRPRQIAFWLMRQCTGLSLPVIGRKFGDRDHTTILHGIRVIDALRETRPATAELTDTLLRLVKDALDRDPDEEPQQ